MSIKFKVRLLKQCVTASVILALILSVNLVSGGVAAKISEMVSVAVAKEISVEEAWVNVQRAREYVGNLNKPVDEAFGEESSPVVPKGERIDEDILKEINERQDLYNN